MRPPRWKEITPSEYAWELEALDYLRQRLPDDEPFRAWSNFEFIAEDGSINEVDLLLVSLYEIHLVEIKSWAGTIDGDAGTWRRDVKGKVSFVDNPLLLTNRKAKKLKSLLLRQRALNRQRLPYVRASVFLSHTGVKCQLADAARTGIYLSEQAERDKGRTAILDFLRGDKDVDLQRAERIPPPLSSAIGRAMEQAGIRTSQRKRRVSDYLLEDLLLETDQWQDWSARHVSLERTRRRVRIYPVSRTSAESVQAAVTQAAEREFRLLDGVVHDGILRVDGYTRAEQGPALIFEHQEHAERLDHFLNERGADLAPEQRLALLRQLAETLKYAHERRLFHRGLCPQRVLVMNPDGEHPRLKIFDWQSARSEGTLATGTRHVDGTVFGTGDERMDVYLAPDPASRDEQPAKRDIFSLGAIGYALLTGQPPAPSLVALQQRLNSEGGLFPSAVLDGVAMELDCTIAVATAPDVSARFDSVTAFLDQLDEAEAELAQSASSEDDGSVSHPLDAGHGDLLEGGFLVEKRLGKGSSAVALLVEREDGKRGVLKVALNLDQNDRLLREGECLRACRHQNIVELYDQYELNGLTALFLATAGTESKTGTYTLADRLREEGRLSLDLLQRFGDQLLGVVQWLEEKGISHRDIKPDNIGVSESRSDKALALVLFDFSLTDASFDNIRAGTPPYLDPFLSLRSPPRWDLNAERFAAAMTLHEMATGVLPMWGDGQSDPAAIQDDVSLDAELFDPAMRDVLTAFFRQALARDPKARFDNAEEMRRAWFRCFEHIDVPTGDTDLDGDDLPALPETLEEATPLAALGLSVRMLNALERLGAHSVGELLALPRIRLYRNKGIGQRTVRRIRALSERLAERLADLETITPTTLGGDDEGDTDATEAAFWSVDQIASRLIPTRQDEETISRLRALLGLEGDHPPFVPLADIARGLALPPDELAETLGRARERWRRQPWMTALRETIAELLQRYGGLMTPAELAAALLGARGSTQEGPLRARIALAAAIAAVETEATRERAHFQLQRQTDGAALLVATSELDQAYGASAASLAAWVAELGEQADVIADEDPLRAPARALAALTEVPLPAPWPPVVPDRMLRLAVAASTRAALSSRGELYPRGMPAARAVKLGASSLLGPKAITPTQVRERIASRYPEAERLPGRPQLDALIIESGLSLNWDGEHYRAPEPERSYLRSTTTVHAAAVAPDAAAVLEERIRRAIDQRSFLALSVAPRQLSRAERYLVATFGTKVFSIERALLQRMREGAQAAGAKWPVVLGADAAPPNSTDRRRLQQLVARAARHLQSEIDAIEQPLLLIRPGLLARYAQMDLLAHLQEHRGPGGRILLLPVQGDDAPRIDGVTLPVVFAASWARVPRGWPLPQPEGTEGVAGG